MTSKEIRPQVVVGYDFSKSAEVALERAIDLACRAPQHVLHFVVAIDQHRGIGARTRETIDYRYAEEIQRELAEHVARLFAGRSTSEEVQFYVHARIGDPPTEILDLAEGVGADLIVVGSHGHTGLKRALLGSVSEKVVREAGCAVIVARPKAYPDVKLDSIERPADAHDRPYVAPHRYAYHSDIVSQRPVAWALN